MKLKCLTEVIFLRAISIISYHLNSVPDFCSPYPMDPQPVVPRKKENHSSQFWMMLFMIGFVAYVSIAS